MKLLGVDVGGTYTDLIFVDEVSHSIHVAKVASTARDQSEGVLAGIQAIGLEPEDLDAFVHGTTVGTNAVIERKGARCGLITTRGFSDVLELRRRERMQVWGLTGSFEPLIPRDLRLEVNERTLPDGEILDLLPPEEVEDCVEKLLAAGADAVVISFLHSYANPTNERAAKTLVCARWPNKFVVAGSDVVSEFREFERTTTATLNAYLQPVLNRYLENLRARLTDAGFSRELIIVQSNGGAMSVDVATRFAVNTVASGPAAGVIAASHIAEVSGFSNVISMDMGGTSLDIAVIIGGERPVVTNREIEFGLPIAIPMLDVNAVGAGGGSIAWVDDAGLLQIGPQSAGADPGPACFDRGGVHPTVTDAHLWLGHIDPERPIGKDPARLDVAKAEQVIESNVARPLALTVQQAADAILRVANLKIVGSIRAISVERGYDPRDFVLIAFGGAGPLHASPITRELGLSSARIPYYPGITSAMGGLVADIQHDFVNTVYVRLVATSAGRDADMERQMAKILETQISHGNALIREQGLSIEDLVVQLEADMRYEGQTHSVTVSLGKPILTQDEYRSLFVDAYRSKYGLTMPDVPIVLVNLRTRVTGRRPKIDLRDLALKSATSLEDARMGERLVWWEDGQVTTPIFDRLQLPLGTRLRGPCILQQPDTTTLVEPSMSASIDDFGSVVVESG